MLTQNQIRTRYKRGPEKLPRESLSALFLPPVPVFLDGKQRPHPDVTRVRPRNSVPSANLSQPAIEHARVLFTSRPRCRPHRISWVPLKAMNLYIARNGETLGPYNDAQAQEYLKQGIFTPDDLSCPEGSEDWRALSELFPAQPSRIVKAAARTLSQASSSTTRNEPLSSAVVSPKNAPSLAAIFATVVAGILFAGSLLIGGWYYFLRNTPAVAGHHDFGSAAVSQLAGKQITAGLTAEDRARKRALALESEILRIKREGVNVEYRIAKANLADASAALADGPQDGDGHTFNMNAVESARQAAIDAWEQNTEALLALVGDRHLINLRTNGEDDDVKRAETRLWAAKQRLANGDRADSEKKSTAPFALPEPMEPPEPTHPLQ